MFLNLNLIAISLILPPLTVTVVDIRHISCDARNRDEDAKMDSGQNKERLNQK